jgi:hypothetical protein
MAPAPTAAPALVPIPPRRPEDIPVLAGLTEPPLPPSRPVALAAADAVPLPDRPGAIEPALVVPAPAALAAPLPPRREAPPPETGDRGGLRALFAAAASMPASSGARKPVATARAKAQPITTASLATSAGPVLNLRFSAAAPELTTAAFTGPAVKPLPVLR